MSEEETKKPKAKASAFVRVKAIVEKVHVDHTTILACGEEAEVAPEIAAILKERGLVE